MYRFAATIQIVTVLTLLIFISNCPINSLFIILLALFNDLTMLPIAYDSQLASKAPDHPDVGSILLLSTTLGLLEMCFSLLWAYASYKTNIFLSDFDIFQCSRSAQSGVWVQMSIAAEILIFSTRAPSYFWNSLAPSKALFTSVMLGCLVISIFAGAINYFGSIYVQDIVIIWIYDFICLFIIDFIKVMYYEMREEAYDVLTDEEIEGKAPLTAQDQAAAKPIGQKDIEMGKTALQKELEHFQKTLDVEDNEGDRASRSRASSNAQRLNDWGKSTKAAIASSSDIMADLARSQSSTNTINMIRKGSNTALIAAKRTSSTAPKDVISIENRPSSSSLLTGGRITVSSNYALQGSTTNLSRASLSSTNLRPHTPANRAFK